MCRVQASSPRQWNTARLIIRKRIDWSCAKGLVWKVFSRGLQVPGSSWAGRIPVMV